MTQTNQFDDPILTRFADLASRLGPAFGEVLSLGWPGVPLILDELRTRSVGWAPAALRSITGFDPVGPDALGDAELEKLAWLTWGREQGYFPDDQPEPIGEFEEARLRSEAERLTPSANRLDAIIARKLPVIGADLDDDPADLY